MLYYRYEKNFKDNNLKVDKKEKNIQRYKEILDLYNIHIKDEIIDLIRNSSEDDYLIAYMIAHLEKLELIDLEQLKQLKQSSKIILYCITKNSLKDIDKFQKQWADAKRLNNENLFVLLMEDVDETHFDHDENKIYKVFRDFKQGEYSDEIKRGDVLWKLTNQLSCILNRTLKVSFLIKSLFSYQFLIFMGYRK